MTADAGGHGDNHVARRAREVDTQDTRREDSTVAPGSVRRHVPPYLWEGFRGGSNQRGPVSRTNRRTLNAAPLRRTHPLYAEPSPGRSPRGRGVCNTVPYLQAACAQQLSACCVAPPARLLVILPHLVNRFVQRIDRALICILLRLHGRDDHRVVVGQAGKVIAVPLAVRAHRLDALGQKVM